MSGAGLGDRKPRVSRRVAVVLRWLAAALLMGLLSSSAPAQTPIDEEQWKRGYHGFVKLCELANLTVIDPADDAARRNLRPEETILVVFGEIDRLERELQLHLQRGGAMLVASDRGDGDGGPFWGGPDLVVGPLEVLRGEDAFRGYLDCPLVSDIDGQHPITAGVSSIATNRPGAIVMPPRVRRTDWQALARFPRLRTAKPWVDYACIAARESPDGGRAVLTADQSMFANQMLLVEDNLLLARNTLAWLSAGGRTTVLILEDERALAPATPEQVDVEIPPPTPEQVQEALRSLPPEALVGFANLAITTLEDEGIPDELVTFLMDKISRRNYHRLMILASLGLLGLLVVHRLFAGAADDVETAARGEDAGKGGWRSGRNWVERQHAAAELLSRFRAEIAGDSAIPWKIFAGRLRIIDQRWATRRLRRLLVAAGGRLTPDAQRYWTRRRLLHLEGELRHARRLHQSGALEYRAAEARGTRAP